MKSETPVSFNSGAEQLSGVLYCAASPRGAVVICNPVFEERKSSQGVLVATARALSQAGFTVLRFDYRGCGDSPGRFADFTTSDWVTDILNAVAYLKSQHSCLRPGLLGLRLGAALAMQCAARDRDCGFVAAWEPVLDGRSYLLGELRKKLIKEMVTFGHSKSTRQAMLDGLHRGESVDFDGYLLCADLYHSICALTESTTLSSIHCPSLCVTVRPRVKAPDAARSSRAGREGQQTQTEWREVQGQPFWNLIGLCECPELVDLTTKWASDACQTADLTAEHAMTAGNPTTGIESAATPQTGSQPISFEVGNAMVRGIMHAAAPGTGNNTAVIFLHGWTGSRLGPHRMFVKTARRLAASGFTCLRFDYRGRGDSDGDAADTTIASMIEDSRAAVNLVRADGTIKHICLLGICSGGKVAIGTAVAERDVGNLVLWSAETLAPLRESGREARRTRSAMRHYFAKALQPGTWSKLIRGRVNMGLVRKALVSDERTGQDELRNESTILERFRCHAADVLFIYGANDPDTQQAADRYCAFCDESAISYKCHKIDDANHSFYGLDWESEVIETTEQWLTTSNSKQQVSPKERN